MKGRDAPCFFQGACGMVVMEDNPVRAPFYQFGVKGEGFSFFGEEKEGEEVFQSDVYEVAFVPESRGEKP